MNYLKGRLKTLEKKIACKGKGIAEWALRHARWEANGGIFSYKSRMALYEDSIRAGEDPEKIKEPKPEKPKTEEEIIERARELSQKFSSYEEYYAYEKKHPPKIDWTEIDKAIKAL